MTVTVILVSPGPIRFAYIFSGMLCVVVVVFGGRVYFSVRVHFFLSFGCVYSLLSLLPVSCSFSGWLSNGGVAFLAFGH